MYLYIHVYAYMLCIIHIFMMILSIDVRDLRSVMKDLSFMEK